MARLRVKTILNFLSLRTSPPSNKDLHIAGTMRRTIGFPQHLTPDGLRAQWGSSGGAAYVEKTPLTNYAPIQLDITVVSQAFQNFGSFADLVWLHGRVSDGSNIRIHGSENGSSSVAVVYPIAMTTQPKTPYATVFTAIMIARVQYIKIVALSANVDYQFSAYRLIER